MRLLPCSLATFILVGCASPQPVTPARETSVPVAPPPTEILTLSFDEVLCPGEGPLLERDQPIRLELATPVRCRVEGVAHFHPYWPEIPGARETYQNERGGDDYTIHPVFGGPRPQREERLRD